MYKRYTGDALPLWQQVYNMVDGKIARLSYGAYIKANRFPSGRMSKRHVPYTCPDEVNIMVKMLSELGPDTSAERCEEIAAYATSPGINQAIYGSTL